MKKFDKNNKILVVIPARNEEKTIDKVVEEIRNLDLPVLVVDDGSSDGTATVARMAGAEVISLVHPLGTWGALQTGFRFAMWHNYHVVVTVDADGQHSPIYLEKLLEPVISNTVDVTIGMYPERLSKARKAALFVFRYLAGINYYDLTSGMRVYGPRAIKLLSSEQATTIDYQDIGILLLILNNGLNIKEIPVTMNNRTHGKSRLFNSWFAVCKYIFYSLLLSIGKRKILTFNQSKEK